jgi:hypothetical protein
MRDGTQEQVRARPGRCVNHPGVPAAGSCQVCGRSLCVACAVPVRGDVIGPECLTSVLEEVPPPASVPAPLPPHGDWLTRAGFGLVVILSVFPWSRFGEGSRFLGAWTLHWSLLAALAGAAGLGVAFLVRRRPLDARVEIAAIALLATLVAVGALLHHFHPPLLSVPSASPLLAVAGAGLALLGAAFKVKALVEARRPHI